MLVERNVTYPSLDGLTLHGTLVEPDAVGPPVLLVHGITADRDEGGFFRDIAAALAERGAPALRFDLRAHGRSGGSMEVLTVDGCVSDISASANWLTAQLGTEVPPAMKPRRGGALAPRAGAVR
jgi:pimeloyl-ACP methyl ester carboxylesterase